MRFQLRRMRQLEFFAAIEREKKRTCFLAGSLFLYLEEKIAIKIGNLAISSAPDAAE